MQPPSLVQPIETLPKNPPPSSLHSDQALWESIWFALATSNHMSLCSSVAPSNMFYLFTLARLAMERRIVVNVLIRF